MNKFCLFSGGFKYGFKQKLFAIVSFLLITGSAPAQWIRYYSAVSDSGNYTMRVMNFLVANTGFAAGEAHNFYIPPVFWGTILKTTNGGVNWFNTLSTNYRSISLIYVLNSSVIFACGDSGIVLRSTNTGNSWQPLATPPVTANLTWSIYFTDAANGFISIPGSTYSTSNSGASWNLISNTGFSKLYFTGASTGFGFNRTGLYKTTNAGVNWILKLTDSLISDFTFLNSSASTAWCFSAPSLYSGTAKGSGYFTSDGGDNWSALYSNVSYDKLTRVKFFDALTGYANNYYGSPSKVSKTTNGGVTWFNPTDSRFDLSNLFFTNQQTGWADGTYLYFAKTNSGPGNLFNPYFARTELQHNSNNINNRISGHNACDPYPFQYPAIEWPKGSAKYIMYEAGLSIGARVNGSLRVAHSLYNNDFDFGYIDINGNSTGNQVGGYGLYNIKTGDGPGVPDWDNWPVSQGAPIQNGMPQVWGNMTTFGSIVDGYYNLYSSPLHAEIKLLEYSFNSPAPYDDILFLRYTIKNRSGSRWDSTYISIFADPDVGDANDDLMGSDKNLNLSYAYNKSNNDPVYGSAPPAVGIKILEGPRSNSLSVSVPFYIDGQCEGDPVDSATIYNYMKGLNRCGDPFIFNAEPRLYVFDGEPEAGTGWIMPFGRDVRIAASVGPFTLQSNETIIFTVAIIAARGSSNVNSVTKLKQIASILPIGVAPVSQNVPEKFSLTQNYPNPFNPATKIKFAVPLNKGGDRGLSVKLTVFDILGREVAVLVNENLKAGTYEVNFDGTKYASGIYFYTLRTDNFTETKKMVLLK